MKAEPTANEPNPQLKNKQQGVNLEMVYRSLLRIASHLETIKSSGGVAHKAETQYTQGMLRQIEVVEHPNLADPASESATSQG